MTTSQTLVNMAMPRKLMLIFHKHCTMGVDSSPCVAKIPQHISGTWEGEMKAIRSTGNVEAVEHTFCVVFTAEIARKPKFFAQQ